MFILDSLLVIQAHSCHGVDVDCGVKMQLSRVCSHADGQDGEVWKAFLFRRFLVSLCSVLSSSRWILPFRNRALMVIYKTRSVREFMASSRSEVGET